MLTSRHIVPAALLLAASAACAAPVPSDILINFGAVNGSVASPGKAWGGEFYNYFGGTSETSLSKRMLQNRANVATDVGFEIPNFGGFSSADRGNGVSYTFNGFTFFGHLNKDTEPNNPMQSYLADNIGDTATPGRDGLTVLRFTSAEQYNFAFTIVTSYHNAVDGDPPATGIADGTIDTVFNIGGTYSMSRTANPRNGVFTGGAIVHMDPSGDGNYDRGGAMISGQSVWNPTLGRYVLDLQMGAGSVGNFAAISALRIQTSAVPEPTAAGVIAAAGLFLAARRRRS